MVELNTAQVIGVAFGSALFLAGLTYGLEKLDTALDKYFDRRYYRKHPEEYQVGFDFNRKGKIKFTRIPLEDYL